MATVIPHTALTWIARTQTLIGELSTVGQFGEFGSFVEVQGKREKRPFFLKTGLEFTNNEYLLYHDAKGLALKILND